MSSDFSISIDVQGVDQTIKDIADILGSVPIRSTMDLALLSGAKVIKQEIEENFEGFKRTGASKNEITISEPMDIQGVRTIKIYWSGPKKRYRIIHLNEFGTIKHPNPRGKGAIERALRAGEKEFYRVIAERVGEQI